MGCGIEMRIVLTLMKKYAKRGRVYYVDLHELYEELCEQGDESCKAKIRKAVLALRHQGLLSVHYKKRNHRGVRLEGWLFEMFKQLDQAYRYGDVHEL